MHSDSKLKFFFLLLSFSIILCLPPFLLGGVYSHTGTNLIIIAVCAAVTLVYTCYLLVLKKSFSISMVVFPLLLIILFAMLQLIPLPVGLLKIVSPKGAYFHLIDGSGAHPATMSVTDTVYSIFRVLSLIFLSVIVTRNIYVGHKRWKQITIDVVIFISTIVIVFSTVLGLMHTTSWLYGKLGKSTFLLNSIIVNPNHAAGFFGISGMLALTSIYYAEFKRKKYFYASLFFLHTVAVIATLSRGGITAYLLAVFLMLALNTKSLKTLDKKRFYIAFVSILLAFFVAFQASELIFREFDFQKEGFFDKVKFSEDAAGYFKDFWFTGSGLGSFSKVFSYYRANPESLFLELENEPLQFILENGIIASLLVFAAFILIVVRGRHESKRRKGLIATLFFIVLHNTLDFNLHNFASLFPVTIVLILLAKPIALEGRKRIAVLSSVVILSVVTLIFTTTTGGQRLMGYTEEGAPYDYETLLYYRPADVRVPLDKALEKINSKDRLSFINASKEIASVRAKAPKYYYGYYLSGYHLLKIGAVEPSLYFFRQSLSLTQNYADHFGGQLRSKYTWLLDKIYTRLEENGHKERIVDLIEINEYNKKPVEQFIFRISSDNEAAIQFAYGHRELFFVSIVRDLVKKNNVTEALALITESLERKDIEPLDRGRLLVYRAKLYEKDKLYDDAYNFYIRGAALTQSFQDYLAAAYCSLHLDEKRQGEIDELMRQRTLQHSANLASYYRWLSRKAFNAYNHSEGFKYLERAASISRNPAWHLEIANTYANRKMHYYASQKYLKIMREFPDYKPALIKERYESEKKLLEEQEEQKRKEMILNGKGF